MLQSHRAAAHMQFAHQILDGFCVAAEVSDQLDDLTLHAEGRGVPGISSITFPSRFGPCPDLWTLDVTRVHDA